MENKNNKVIRFVCASDTHGMTDNLKIPDGDVFIHAGDWSNVGEPEKVQKFNDFLASLPHPIKVVIAGNHEVSFDIENYDRLKDHFLTHMRNPCDPIKVRAMLTNCIYLEDSFTMVHGYKIYGSPWSPEFFNWGFNAKRGEEIMKIWDKIPDDTEILITHGPPYGIMDDDVMVGERIGCHDLLKVVKERVKPLVHVFGHVHEGHGVIEEDGTKFINAAICDEHYKPILEPIIFELPVKEEKETEKKSDK